MLILGIETSCDETAAAVVRDGREIVSSVISSQVPIHKRFGGVVPELASREHLDKIVPVVNEAFERAKLRRATSTALRSQLDLGSSVHYSSASLTRRRWLTR